MCFVEVNKAISIALFTLVLMGTSPKLLIVVKTIVKWRF